MKIMKLVKNCLRVKAMILANVFGLYGGDGRWVLGLSLSIHFTNETLSRLKD
jgi:hypothetical protein